MSRTGHAMTPTPVEAHAAPREWPASSCNAAATMTALSMVASTHVEVGLKPSCGDLRMASPPKRGIACRASSADGKATSTVNQHEKGVFLRISRIALVLATTLAAASALVPRPSAADARTTSWCQGSESLAAARHDLGVPIRVKARVARAFWARSSSGRPTFLDLGYAYPSSRRLSVVIWGSDRVNFPRAPERMFPAGTQVCVQGIASMYRGVMQMQVGIWDSQHRLLSV
jgi:hypothetical protein